MRNSGFISFFAAALMLGMACVSCDKEEKEVEKADVIQPEDNSGDTLVWEVEAFLPSYCADKTVVAWYSVYSETDYKKKIEAVFLFSDSTVIVTKSKTYSREDGRDPSREVMHEGSYQVLEGDFDNGSLQILLPGGVSLRARIKDGELTLMAVSYVRQDIAGIPASTQPTDAFNGKIQAYLPSLSIELDYVAWYQYVAQDANKTRIDALFMDADSLMLYTRSVFYASGRKPVYELLSIGRYIITEGDFTTGKMDLKFSEIESYDVTVTDGQMPIQDKTFIKQDMADLPDEI
jgi:hypothetical protein